MASDPLVNGIIEGRMLALWSRDAGRGQATAAAAGGIAIVLGKIAAWMLTLLACVIAPLPGLVAVLPLLAILVIWHVANAVANAGLANQGAADIAITVAVLACGVALLIHFLRFTPKMLSLLERERESIARRAAGSGGTGAAGYAILSFVLSLGLSVFLLWSLIVSVSYSDARTFGTWAGFREDILDGIVPEFGWIGMLDPGVVGAPVAVGLWVCLALAAVAFVRALKVRSGAVA